MKGTRNDRDKKGKKSNKQKKTRTKKANTQKEKTLLLGITMGSCFPGSSPVANTFLTQDRVSWLEVIVQQHFVSKIDYLAAFPII